VIGSDFKVLHQALSARLSSRAPLTSKAGQQKTPSTWQALRTGDEPEFSLHTIHVTKIHLSLPALFGPAGPIPSLKPLFRFHSTKPSYFLNRQQGPGGLAPLNATGSASPTYSRLHKAYLLHGYLFKDFLYSVTTEITAKLFSYLFVSQFFMLDSGVDRQG